MTDKTSETGLWLTDDGKVVRKAPEGGSTQLVRPGGTITDAVQARIDSLDADADAPAISAAEALGNPVPDADPVDDPKPVTSEPAKKAPAKKAAAKK